MSGNALSTDGRFRFVASDQTGRPWITLFVLRGVRVMGTGSPSRDSIRFPPSLTPDKDCVLARKWLCPARPAMVMFFTSSSNARVGPICWPAWQRGRCQDAERWSRRWLMPRSLAVAIRYQGSWRLRVRLGAIAQGSKVSIDLVRGACLLQRKSSLSTSYWQRWNQLREQLS